jgi:hypothetical protein
MSTFLLYIKRNYGVYLWLIGVLAISWAFGYHEIVNMPPQSIHAWRQADGASIALNYYQNGMDFLKPELMHLRSDDFTTGYAVSEFTGVYYFIALVYKIFGHHDFIFRFVHSLLFFAGLYSLFKLANRFLKNELMSVFVSLLVFSSPIVAYYANNFLPDTVSFSFVLISWYFFFAFQEKQDKRSLIWLSLFLSLAILLKITNIINAVVIVLIWLSELRRKEFTKIQAMKWGAVLVSLLLVSAWYIYVIKYNAAHKTTYFSNTIQAIWTLEWKDLGEIFKHIRFTWGRELLISWGYYVLLALLLVLIVFFKRLSLVHRKINLFLLTGVLIYFILWFKQFCFHDYYVFTALTCIVLMLVFSLSIIQKHAHKYVVYFTTLLLGVLLIANVHRSSRLIHERYANNENSFNMNRALFEVEPYLRSIGIEAQEKVISIPDPTFAQSLYLMNQKGWTGVWESFRKKEEFEQAIADGAKYLIVADEKLLNEAYIQDYIQDPLGSFKGIFIYRLQ